MRTYLSIGGIALFLIGFGCAVPRSETSGSERSSALKAALLHQFAHWDPYSQGVPFYLLVDGESTGWLLKEFRGHRPAVIGMQEVLAYKSPPDASWVKIRRWAGSVKTIGRHQATVYVGFYTGIGPPTEFVYLLELHRDKTGWLVDSEQTTREKTFWDFMPPPHDFPLVDWPWCKLRTTKP